MNVRNIVSYFTRRKMKISKFLIVGGSATVLYLCLLFLMVRYLGFDTALLENLANALALEISIVYNFFMSRAITWSDREKEKGGRLFIQMVKFHLGIGATILFRLSLFLALQQLGVPYMYNAAIGIVLTAIFNYAIYDVLIFR